MQVSLSQTSVNASRSQTAEQRVFMNSQNNSDANDALLEENHTPIEPRAKKIPLVEVFGPTVQGEGAVIGMQTFFLRFGLCDYRCVKCDSMHAVDPIQVKKNAKWLTQEEIFTGLERHRLKQAPDYNSTRWVTFSGGNPCIHDLTNLVERLHSSGYSVQVETQGTLCPDWLKMCEVVCVSPKGPGMGEKLEIEKLDHFIDELAHLNQFYLKLVVFDERDLETARMLYERYVNVDHEFPVLRKQQFFLSLGNPWPPGTVDNFNMSGTVTGFTLRDRLIERYESLLNDIMHDKSLCNVRFLPQLHVLLWGNKMGV